MAVRPAPRHLRFLGAIALAGAFLVGRPVHAEVSASTQNAHQAASFHSDVPNARAALDDVNRRTGGEPDVALYWSPPAALVSLKSGLTKIGLGRLAPVLGVEAYNKYGHIAIGVRLPGETEATIYDIQPGPRGLVGKYGRMNYLFGNKADLTSVDAAKRGMTEVQLHDLPRDVVESIAAYFKDLGERHERGEAEYALLSGTIRTALNGRANKVCEQANCAQYTNRGLAAGGLISKNGQSQWPLKQLIKFIAEHPGARIIKYEPMNEPALPPKYDPMYDGPQDIEPKPHVVVKVNRATGLAEVRDAEPDYQHVYRPRFQKLPWYRPGRVVAATSRGVKGMANKVASGERTERPQHDLAARTRATAPTNHAAPQRPFQSVGRPLASAKLH